MTEAKHVVERIVAADRAVTERAATHRHEPLAKLAGQAAEIADQPPLIALSIGTALVGLVSRRPELVRGGARMLAAHLVATGLKNAVKHSVDRTRPKKTLEDGEHRFEKGKSEDHAETSFPSGHLAGAVAVSRALAHEVDGTAVATTLVTSAVAAAQAPAGKHYLTDMAAGALIGWLAEAVVGAAFDYAEPKIDRALARLERG